MSPYVLFKDFVICLAVLALSETASFILDQYILENVDPHNRVVYITGCDTGLWSVINNTGMNMLGDVELSPISLYEKGFEVNMYGYIRVMKTFLSLVRQSKEPQYCELLRPLKVLSHACCTRQKKDELLLKLQQDIHTERCRHALL